MAWEPGKEQVAGAVQEGREAEVSESKPEVGGRRKAGVEELGVTWVALEWSMVCGGVDRGQCRGGSSWCKHEHWSSRGKRSYGTAGSDDRGNRVEEEQVGVSGTWVG